MNQLNNILQFANNSFLESEKQIKKHDEFIQFITPLFKQNFGLVYRDELSNLYSYNARQFIKAQREIFNSKTN